MSNALVKSIPLTLSGSGAGMKAIPVSDEQYYAAEAGYQEVLAHPKGDSAHYGSLLTDTSLATNYDSAGTYVDTFYNEAIGTHPGTSLSIGSNTTVLYQSRDSVDEFDAYWQTHSHLPVAVDSNGDIWEMDSASFLLWGKRLAEENATGELAGSFRLSTSTPSGGTWESFIDGVFEDTKTNGSTTYNLYRKTLDDYLFGSISSPDTFMLCLDSSEDGSIREMGYDGAGGNDEAAKSAMLALAYGKQKSGIGDYQLLPAGQTPTGNGETGTWVARGTAIDTRNTTENLQYSTVQYTSPFFATQFTRQYTGQYTGVSFADVPGTFAGTRGGTFEGVRSYSDNYGGSRNYTDDYVGPRNFVSERTFEGVRTYADNYSSQFEGTRQFAGSRNYAAQYTSAATNFAGTQQFTGVRVGVTDIPIQYSGVRTSPANYSGVRQFTGARSFAGTRQFTGSRQESFAGQRTFAGTRTFAGVRSYAGQRDETYEGVRTQVSVAFDPVNQEDEVYSKSTPGNFTGQNPGSFTGPAQRVEPINRVAPGNFLGPVTSQFTSGVTQFTTQVTYYEPGTFTGTVAVGGNFEGGLFSTNYATGQFERFTNFLGTRQFAGSRNFAAQYTSAAGQFEGTFAGSRSFTGQYTGDRTFTGNRTFAGSRNFSAQYSGVRNYTGNFGGTVFTDFAGTRATTYTNQYTGQYATQYTGQFTSQYSNQFTGETLVAITETIETYTLYCRISEA